MSLRSGKGGLSLKNPSKARLRELSRRSASQRSERRQFSDEIPF